MLVAVGVIQEVRRFHVSTLVDGEKYTLSNPTPAGAQLCLIGGDDLWVFHGESFEHDQSEGTRSR